MKKNTIKLVQCRNCEQLFYAPRRSRTRYCSYQCRKEHHSYQSRRWWRIGRHIKTRQCPICQTTFPTNHNQKYCSPTCALKGYRNACKQSDLRRHRWKELNGIHQVGNPQVHTQIKRIERRILA